MRHDGIAFVCVQKAPFPTSEMVSASLESEARDRGSS